ncbi:chemotaxis protein CheA [Catenovulum sediminis]|uniref:Chemotaxis protein CheA n=1 Tax=Catenovulum sediminis TaxID=1740262 RepID=A0ABV1RMB0_9ALTE|nr:chemotaxis protein CheA [Catenovulum sediminis]
MKMDLSQFYQVFFEESFEGLDAMEAELLRLSNDTPDVESINTIFRAAHSIKGGSGTFGFEKIASFTHVVETYLDLVREGKRKLATEQVDLLLRSVDCLRDMLTALSQNQTMDESRAIALKAEFESLLDEPPTANSTETQQLAKPQGSKSSWYITFIPHREILLTGNEPLYMLQELAQLGEVEVVVNTQSLPALDLIDVESCYFSWQIELISDCSESQIKEIFEWVEDDCEINISRQGFQTKDTKTQVTALSSSQVKPADENTQFSIEPSEPTKSETEVDSHTKIRTDKQLAEPATKVQASPTQSTALVGDSLTTDKAKQTSQKIADASSIRVSIDKVDSLINMVGELVITQAMLMQLSESEFDNKVVKRMKQGLAQLEHNTRELQESVMRIRMLPISFVFNRFVRLVRDSSQKLGKKIELVLLGEQTELDKTVMEKISDPMVHLVRNSVDHGIESPQERMAAGKSEIGKITLNAYHQGGNIVIEIIDDGRGLSTEKIRQKAITNGLINATDELTDEQINLLIFEPGFSTAETVSDLSGRGVGMDVVKSNIQALNGAVDVESTPNQGTKFKVRLPLTLAILDGQLVRVGQHIYIIPLVNIIESLQINPTQVSNIGGQLDVLDLRGEYVPIVRLAEVFAHQSDSHSLNEGLLVVVEVDSGKAGIFVDDLLAQQQVVIKSLEANYCKVEGISGATILGDGTVSLIIDVVGLVKVAGIKNLGTGNITIAEHSTSCESL